MFCTRKKVFHQQRMIMKKLYLLFLGFALMFAACDKGGSNKKNAENPQDKGAVETVVDSLKLQKQKIDSLTSNGMMLHRDIYPLGKVKTITFTVHSVQVGTDTLNYINLRKDCGNEYYYSWENAEILYGECDAFVKAIDEIKGNLNRAVEHEEEYFYVTKDDIALVATNSGKKWDIRLSVDTYKSNSSVTLSAEELDALRGLVLEGKRKIDELSK